MRPSASLALLSVLALGAAFAVPSVASAKPASLPASGKPFKLGGLTVVSWYPSTRTAKLPLILFSHGYGGCGAQSTFLTTALASAGYIVVAPNHADASCGPGDPPAPEIPFEQPAAWNDTTYLARKTDMVGLVAALKADKAWNAAIDWTRVAGMGHSLGGYTMLGLGGAWPSWDQPVIKAVLALSPYCAPYLDEGALGSIAAPVMYQGGTLDYAVTPTVKRPDGCYARTATPAYFVEFAGAAHNAWSDLGNTNNAQIIYYARNFFDVTLKGADPSQLLTTIAGVTTYWWKR